jgi:hypothetical protein
MAAKPSFRSNAVSKVDLSSTLQRGAIGRFAEPTPAVEAKQAPIVEQRPAPVVAEPRSRPVIETSLTIAPKRQIDSRKKKLAHLKTLLEYEEKKEITNMLHELADVIGHNIQFSIFNRGLLLAALAQKDDFLRVAEKLQGLERPSNGDMEAFRDYESKIGQLIFNAFDIRGSAPRRVK